MRAKQLSQPAFLHDFELLARFDLTTRPLVSSCVRTRLPNSEMRHNACILKASLPRPMVVI